MSRTKPAPSSRTVRARKKAGSPGRRGYAVGHETRQMIVTVAGEVLVESGYAGLTLKRVADAAGISVGNLNYHFRTKESLVEVVIEHVLTDFASRFEDIVRRRIADGSDALGALLQWAMDESCANQYTRLARDSGHGVAQPVGCRRDGPLRPSVDRSRGEAPGRIARRAPTGGSHRAGIPGLRHCRGGERRVRPARKAAPAVRRRAAARVQRSRERRPPPVGERTITSRGRELPAGLRRIAGAGGVIDRCRSTQAREREMSDFPIIPADDTVLVLTHMQNEFAHPDGKGRASSISS